ncbi:MAG: coproporphyrinogen III oxidase, partial [Armatimonadetes bacterium]|nr:coproporphyrinogen III oxidase [Armatimonadota bacterium]NIO76068.1 coproporphyrinogen III oxidase [Armatimonadota bacterium]NIO97006.1 coproporphyrinogen III oxidase [Armatimonadota bacterium]
MARSIYIHIAFCISKCPYCDFTSYAGMEAFYGEYVEALAAEISHAEPQEPISTIYFGGGTPTVLSNGQLSAILAAVRERFEV